MSSYSVNNGWMLCIQDTMCFAKRNELRKTAFLRDWNLSCVNRMCTKFSLHSDTAKIVKHFLL
jgi:hypothetical protein